MATVTDSPLDKKVEMSNLEKVSELSITSRLASGSAGARLGNMIR